MIRKQNRLQHEIQFMNTLEDSMNTEDLIEALDQRYGNPYASKECGLIHEAIKQLRELNDMVNKPVKTYAGGKPNRVTKGDKDENCNGK